MTTVRAGVGVGQAVRRDMAQQVARLKVSRRYPSP